MTQPLSFTRESARKAMRRKMRRARARLSVGEQRQAALGLSRQLHYLAARGPRIGLYLPQQGELDVVTAVRKSPLHDKQHHLPVLDPLNPGRLLFCPWLPDTRLVSNRFGIPEPDLRRARPVPLWSLDLLLMPLVAFDDQGNRLGMGGGFYDRTLAELARRPARPRLLGVAYEFQRVAELPTADWDMPMDGVVTDSGIYSWR
jgi:5-formyltetrahydrofolate cyclo-ligase